MGLGLETTDLAALSLWAYVVVFALAAIDAVFPIVPSESSVIVAGVLAAQGELDPWVVLAAAALGAVTGDSVAYGLGRIAARRGRTVDDLHGRSGRVLRAARSLLRRRGASVLVAARFVPGGRVAATMASGYVRYPLRAFLQGVGAGAALWAAYSTAVGYVGGRAFDDEPWMGIAAGFAIALTFAGLVELVRRYSPSSSGA